MKLGFCIELVATLAARIVVFIKNFYHLTKVKSLERKCALVNWIVAFAAKSKRNFIF